MKWSNLSVKLAGDDISPIISDCSLDQSLGGHHQLICRLPVEERSIGFINVLQDSSEKWIGEPFVINDLFEGVVVSLGLSRTKSGGSELIINALSKSIFLDDGINTRSFGKKSLKKILDEITSKYSEKIQVEIKPEYTRDLKYTVQYYESNFDFINRLAASYGEWLYYDGKKLLFAKPVTDDIIRLEFGEVLTHFDLFLKTSPPRFNLSAYDYKANLSLKKSFQYLETNNPYLKISMDKAQNLIYSEHSSIPLSLSMNDKDIEHIYRLNQNNVLSQMVILQGTSTNINIRIGKVIEIIDPRKDLLSGGFENYGKYIITNLRHNFTANADNYINYFEAIPADSAVPPYIHSVTPPACVNQIGKVIDNNDPKALGRIRVQFSWQENFSGEDSKTPWIRVTSAMAGGDKGFYMIPEIDDQVLVAFEQNHPERPYVLAGGMYHGYAKPEFFDTNNYKKAIKTKGKNQIVLYDETGQESMTLSTPKDFKSEAIGGKMDLIAKDKITMESNNEEIFINALNKVSINANVIELNAKSIIKINGLTIEIKAERNLDATGDQINIEGVTTDVKGSVKMNVESSTLTSISGLILKLN